ncbi:hypothetical protein J7E28_07975 [Microbacterium sp. ISL-108]|nr:hypothetical protein [Microbacterium sp. ISL-108]RKN69522.1 hypothetical protein D7252_07995 [Microbacterium sp. CGR2]
MQTMIRTQVVVDGVPFLLSQGQDLDALKRSFEAALSTGAFVDFSVVGNREVSVLVSAHTSIVLSIDTVQFDERDDGDLETPYGGMFDF